MTSPREWLRNILSDDGGLPWMPIGRYALHLTHTDPTGTRTEHDFPCIDVGSGDYVRAEIAEDYDGLRIDTSTRYVPSGPRMLRLVLTGRLVPNDADQIATTRVMPPAPTRAEVLAEHVPVLDLITEYIAGCDCDYGTRGSIRFDRDAHGNRLKDDVPARLWAEHVDAALRKAGL